MKYYLLLISYIYFIKALTCLHIASTIYKVLIGSSKRMYSKRAQIQKKGRGTDVEGGGRPGRPPRARA